MASPRLQPALLLLAVAASAPACTKAELQPVDDIRTNIVDNLLEIEGELCTDPPLATDFPVKILFIIDGSGSMQFVDNPTQRARAVEEVILRTRANPSVSYAIVRFNESDAVLTKPGAEITAADPLGVDLSGAFTRDPAILQTAVEGLRVADSVTDYQGALSAAFQILFQDMIGTPPATLGRTKYVVLFLSDGDPFPDCCSDASLRDGLCAPTQQIISTLCTDPDVIRQNPNQLPFLVGGEDYNQPYQIYGAAQDIMDLAENFNVGELRIHTAFLFDPSLGGMLDANGCYTIAGVGFVCPDEARELLGTVAQIGDGVFRDFSRAEEIDFLSFDLLSIKRENTLKNLIVTNTNLVPTAQGLALDSDADGLLDDLEFEVGLNRLSSDTDGDGFSDSLEYAQRRNGFDPVQVNPGCSGPDERRDVDADGLRQCEELVLRTSTELYDTDADGLPDGLEVVLGLDPTRADALSDADLDGVRNGDEVRFHTGVGLDEAAKRPSLAYRYRTEALGVNEDLQQCYRFEVKNVQLGTPLARPGEADSYGRNDILVYMAQAPFDDPDDFGAYKVACVEGRYVAPDFKDPPDGRVVLTPEDFKLPEELTRADCVGPLPPPGSAP
jgi:hypothetical protein